MSGAVNGAVSGAVNGAVCGAVCGSLDHQLLSPTAPDHCNCCRGLQKWVVKNAHDAVKLLHIGTERRRKAFMPLNPVSSRSHAIYQVIVDKNNADNTKGVASLYFADLMGSEKMIEGLKDRADEAPNDELLSLGRVIQSLAEASKGNSKAVATYRGKRQ